MAKPVKLSTHTFKTQMLALKYYREILSRYEDGDRITNLEHDAYLRALITERYDPALRAHGEPVKGDGQISHFERRLNTSAGWSTSGFWVIRLDGSATDFSYIDAVKGKPKGIATDFYNACRHAVAIDYILAKKGAFDEYADASGRMPCELTTDLVTSKDAHLDHARPYFGEIVKGFRAAKGWTKEIPDGVITNPKDAQQSPTFVKSAVADAFRDYHRDLAILRIVSAKANLSTAHFARPPKVRNEVRI